MKQQQHSGWQIFAMMSALSLGACAEDGDELGPAELELEDEQDAAQAPSVGSDELTTQQDAGAFPGFGVDIDVSGDDVVLDWSVTGPASTPSSQVMVLRSTIAAELADLDDLGPSVEEILLPGGSTSYVDLGAASRTQLTPTYYYRVLVDGQAVELSTMVLKVTTPAFAGFTKFGLCMLGGPQTASDIVDAFGSAVDGVYAWNAQTQSWLQWMAADGSGPFGDFPLPYGGVVAVGFNQSVHPFLSLAGTVPTDEAFEIDNATGLNLQTLPALYDGPSESSYWVDQAGYWGVGEWDPQSWTQNWYWGPGYQEVQMEACKPYYFQLPPDSCSGDDECSDGQFCSFVEEAACGAFASGVCKARPIGCDPDGEVAEVCGCDGVTYDNACEAELAGTAVAEPGACANACTMLGFDDPADVLGFQMTGDWGLYDQTPPSYSFQTVSFGDRAPVLGTDGNRADGLGYEDEDSEIRTTAMMFGDTLSFDSWHIDEGGGYYDRKTVEISLDQGQTWTQLSNCYTGLNPQAYCEYLYIQRAGDDWDSITLDTSAFAGQTGIVRFTYDTVDSCCSFEQGWFIDDIQTGAGC